jgi:capsular polysaccharide biosynthesis protein
VVAFATSAAGVYSYELSRPIYEASAKLILTNEQIEAGLIDYNTLMANGMLIQTYGEIVKTPRLMSKVVEAHPELNMTQEQLMAAVSAKTSDNQIMSIVVRNASYARAAEIANDVAGVMVAEIPAIMKMNNVFLLDKAPALPDPEPVNLRPEIKTLIAFLLSWALGIGIALLRHYFDDRIRSARDVEATLGIETLASLPRLKRNEVYPLIGNSAEEKAGEQTQVVVSH